MKKQPASILHQKLIELTKRIVDNLDLSNKQIGDRVLVWNKSSMTDINQKKDLIDLDVKYFIVEAIEQDCVYDVHANCPFYIRQDLIIVDPCSKLKFRVSSTDVHVVDRNGQKIKDNGVKKKD